MRTLISRAPTRIDFGGGWTDVPPYSTSEGGVVCNLAIQRYATVRFEEDPEGTARSATLDADDGALARAWLARARLSGVRVALHSDYPRGAGLGGSSAAGVAMAGAIRAWRNEGLDDRGTIAEESRAVEVGDLGVAGGRQDHYASALGGALHLTFGEATHAQRIPLSAATRDSLEARCRIFYTGQSRISGTTITGVLEAWERGETRVVQALARMKVLAGDMAGALERGDLDSLGRLVEEHWVHQRTLHPGIPTALIDEIIETARREGAQGAKALGASGGGCVLVIAPEERIESLRRRLTLLAEPVPFRIDVDGLTVVDR
jgi:D-glycero-alpha-D-manno-heptose-7-phosphate kinase